MKIISEMEHEICGSSVIVSLGSHVIKSSRQFLHLATNYAIDVERTEEMEEVKKAQDAYRPLSYTNTILL